ncbi:hypothetical protein ACFQ71_02935 [Streptomyces sp. NPDC056534]|uniref:hypothetical protein n=1 Tax=Streptomyces sp. NPDC056534 TaxID=3345857 RepID=UPI003699675D
MPDNFWDAIRTQLKELESAKSADDVLRILAHENDPDQTYPRANRPDEGFFGGSGGEDTVREALEEAGWTVLWSRDWCWYAMTALDGSVITYCEGDIYRGDRR